MTDLGHLQTFGGSKWMSVLPRERTSESRTGMSALGQSQTHAAKQIPHTAVMIYSINSSARPLSESGTAMPKLLAVLRLMMSSTLVDC
jgi:hypothetical protein